LSFSEPPEGQRKVFLKTSGIAAVMDAAVRSVIVMAAMLVLAQLGALVMVGSVLDEENQAFENPNDPLIPVYYAIAMVLFTFAILYIIKKKRDDIVRYVFLGAVAYTILYVVLAIALLFDTGVIALLAALLVTAVMTYYLVKKPEWYVIDAAGIMMAIGVIGILGISLQILPVLILLVILAVYDAISVYGTKHMVALADGVTQMKLPILLVIPKHRGYSYLDQKSLKKQIEDGDEREAMFMGLGDVIIPGVLIASAYFFLPESTFAGAAGSLVVALGAMLGGLAGFSVLMTYVLKGNPQAGLPLLNGGTIAGYAIAYLLVYGDLSFGMTIPW